MYLTNMGILVHFGTLFSDNLATNLIIFRMYLATVKHVIYLTITHTKK